MRRPLILPAIVFILGILAAEYIPVPLSASIALAILLLPIAWIFRGFSNFHPLILIIVFSLALIQHKMATDIPPGDISNWPAENDVKYSVVGVVDSAVRKTEQGRSRRQSFSLSVQSIRQNQRTYRCRGRVQCTWFGSAKDLQYGDLIRCWGELGTARQATNPGEFDYRAYLARQGIYRQLTVFGDKSVRILKSGYADPFRAWVERIRLNLAARLDRYFEKTESALLKALLIGERRDIPYEINEAFISTGTVHVLSISGMHIVLIGGCWYFLWQWAGIPQKINAALTMLIIFVYSELAGMMIPVARSAIMGILFYGSVFLARDRDGLSSLALAALWLLLANTRWLFSISFQLSFLCVLSIMLWSLPVEQRLKKIPFLFLRRGLSLSIATLAGAGLVVCFYFSTFSPISFAANLIIVPMVTAIIIAGFLSLMAGSWLWVGGFLIKATSFLIRLMLILNDFLAGIPFGHWHVTKPRLWMLIAYYALLVVCWFTRKWRRRNGVWISSLCALTLAVCMAANYGHRPSLSITALNVKQAGIYLLRAPNGKHVLVNAGPGKRPAAGQWILIPFLKSKGLESIDIFVLTDWGKRYAGAFPELAKVFKVRHIIVPGDGGGKFPADWSGRIKKEEVVRVNSHSEIKNPGPLQCEIFSSSTGRMALVSRWENSRVLILPSVDEELVEDLNRKVEKIDFVFLYLRTGHIPKKIGDFLLKIQPKAVVLSGLEKFPDETGLPSAEFIYTAEKGAVTLELFTDHHETLTTIK